MAMVEGEKGRCVLYAYVLACTCTEQRRERGKREMRENGFSRDIWEGFFVGNLIEYLWRILGNSWRRLGGMDILENIPKD